MDIVYLDFNKAFDKVSHDLLIYKLKHLGLNGHVLEWIRSFLSKHTFCVKVGQSLSDWMPVTSSVPQGSVLGPILFLLYTYDLLHLLRYNYSAYADDIKLYGDPRSDGLQNKLNIIGEWCNNWLILINHAKCCVIHFGYNNVNNTYNISGETLKKVSAQCDLGVIIGVIVLV